MVRPSAAAGVLAAGSGAPEALPASKICSVSES